MPGGHLARRDIFNPTVVEREGNLRRAIEGHHSDELVIRPDADELHTHDGIVFDRYFRAIYAKAITVGGKHRDFFGERNDRNQPVSVAHFHDSLSVSLERVESLNLAREADSALRNENELIVLPKRGGRAGYR